jgi:uncharacterized protein YodC (DUF2158 family)
MKIPRVRSVVERKRIERGGLVHKELRHPVVVQIRERGPVMIVTDVAGNGRLAVHRFMARSKSTFVFRHSNRMAKTAVRIALGIRYLQSCGVIHRNLLLDCY